MENYVPSAMNDVSILVGMMILTSASDGLYDHWQLCQDLIAELSEVVISCIQSIRLLHCLNSEDWQLIDKHMLYLLKL